MKKVLFGVLAIMIAFTVTAQSIIDAEDGRNPNDFYQRGIVVGKNRDRGDMQFPQCLYDAHCNFASIGN